MRSEKLPRRISVMIAVGLLMTTTPPLINDWVHIPDFLRGVVIGVGFVMEIRGIILANRFRKATKECGLREQ
ncbi:hypothetical protein SAMN05216490_0689 [Mucilaginibacter mallensis]|uniref:Uncharacterized protein n=1 Tax=Mucilaginibacter mallensis TaxID=652787 RepID=A0A1H1Q4B4_MUCMA|nr:hypothetical protein [Mucilaginibacter mallensis]SDS18250.1 hypothetical protein SAMN05216490_0689 [Mucilaginibacter mallensis]